MEQRHGLQNDKSLLSSLQDLFSNHYDLKRNTTSATPGPEDFTHKIADWKLSPNKKKTTHAALVMCLNLGIPPPDIQRPQKCPSLEAFVDPNAYPDFKVALQTIGKNLQAQYETISSRVKYKQILDPYSEDLRRMCSNLRRNAKDDRILLHYNGHGVPQPTQSGEIWVFNRAYTQYIPVSLYDLQNWIGAPCIMVIDTNAAGNVIENNKKFIQKRIDDDANNKADMASPSPIGSYLETIQLGACQSNETLPMNPDLPADLFTCCLTTPIEISVKWFLLFSPLREHGYYDILKNKDGNIEIPGKLTDRKTPLGELNWIFIAITDTIAWKTLTRSLFMKLFRQDLVTAALFRNFLLAKKIMPEVGCHPISDPPLPDVLNNPMWDSWELAIDQVLAQLLKKKKSEPEEEDLTDIPQLQVPPPTPATAQAGSAAAPAANLHNGTNNPPAIFNSGMPASRRVSADQQSSVKGKWVYQNCTFFQQHLTAFDVWLQYGSSKKEAPEQLPIVLQVLLSQAHRLRALQLLAKFLDLGPWAVYLSLSIGMCPYIQKLLQSPSPELKPVLIFIWARIMSVDYKNTQQELVRGGYNYFIQMFTFQPRKTQHLSSNGTAFMLVDDVTIENQMTFADQKATSAFVLSMFARDNVQGQKLAFSVDLVKTCFYYIETSESPLLRQWSALLVGELIKDNFEAVVSIVKFGIVDKILTFISDPIPEVRGSIISILSNFILFHIDDFQDPVICLELNQQDVKIATEVLSMYVDGSPLIRKEVVCFFSRFVVKYISFFLISAYSQLEEEVTLVDDPSLVDEVRRKSPAFGSIFATVWKAILILGDDPHDEVKDYSQQVIDYVLLKLNESQLGESAHEMELYLLQKRSGLNPNGDVSDDSLSFGGLSLTRIDGLGHKNRNANRRIQSVNIADSSNHKMTVNGSMRKTRPRTSSNASETDSITSTLSSKVEGFKQWFKLLQSGDSVNGNINDGGVTGIGSLLSQQPMTLPYGSMNKPRTPRFKLRERDNGKPILPIVSGFFDYSREYFQEPQLGPSESNEPGSKEYIRMVWRRNRNEQIIQVTQSEKELALTDVWKESICKLNNKTQPKLIQFTQFEKWVVTSDEKDIITTFDWNKQKEMSKFSNGNPLGTKITDIKFLNEDSVPLLMTGSSDGIVKIYKNFEDKDDCTLLTSWRALTDIIISPRPVGLVTEWQQSRGSLLVTGDVKVIKLWDAPREKCILDIPIRSTSQVLTMTSDLVSGNIIVTGFQDGSMRVYDRRLDSRDSMIKVYKPQNLLEKSPLKNVHMQRGGMRELVSGSVNGLVRLWDIRVDSPLETFRPFSKTMTTAYIHEHAPIIACADKEVKMYSTKGKLITNVSNSSFINTLNGNVRSNSYVNTLALHPHRMMLATNYNQSAEVIVNGYWDKEAVNF